MKIGVLAVQGNFREHAAMLRRLGAEVVEVRKPEELEGLDGLVVPGGESTAIARLIDVYRLEGAIREFDRPVFGTCAGLIMLGREHLDLVDLTVQRNAYGRQVASF
jgi:pyridoxal 5'-phosphate synthase pdxT subunit